MNLENLAGTEIVLWCNICQAEQAVDVIEVELNQKWVSLDIGTECLTKLRDQGRMDM
jgi:hypothetical protein